MRDERRGAAARGSSRRRRWPGGRAVVTERASADGPCWVVRPRFRRTTPDTERAVGHLEEAFETWATIDDHDHVATLLEWTTDRQPRYTVRAPEYGTLRRHLDAAESVVWPDEAITIGQELCTAVAFAHDRGVTHPTLDPASVLLRTSPAATRPRPVIADWGIGSTLCGRPAAIWDRSIHYDAPEQLRPADGTDEGVACDESGASEERTDCYRLGAIVYELLTGRPPFVGDRLAIGGQQRSEQIVPPSERVETVPQAVDEPIVRALGEDAADRYPSVAAFGDALSAVELDTRASAAGVTGTWAQPYGGPTRVGTTAAGLESVIAEPGAGETDHVSAETGGFSDRPTVAWRYRTNGPIRSVPVVAHDSVYVGDDDGTVTAIHATTGDRRWAVDVTDRGHTATAVGAGLVVVARREGLSALDTTTGETRWESAIGTTFPPAIVGPDDGRPGGQTSTRRSGQPPTSRQTAEHGETSGCSTVVVAGSSDGTVAAVETATGKRTWQVEVDAQWSTPPAVEDGTVFLGTVGGGLVAIDAGDGETRWRFRTDGRIVGAPAVRDGTVYLSEGDGTVYAVDAETGAYEWSIGLEGQTRGAPAVVEETVYVVATETAAGTVSAVDTATGDREWTCDIEATLTSGPTVTAETVLVGSDAGVYGIDRDWCEKRWYVELGDAVESPPAIASDRNGTMVVVGGHDYLVRTLAGRDR